MKKMRELYNKVASDVKLQEKFLEAMKNAEADGGEKTIRNLVLFAKDIGFDVTPYEIRDFFIHLSKQKEADLSDADLEAVSGGKKSVEERAAAHDQFYRRYTWTEEDVRRALEGL